MLIGMNMSGYEQDRARDLVAQGGYLTPAQEVHYAVAGTGTDEEALRRALEGRSPEEIAEIRAEYARTQADTEYLARELTSVRLALADVVTADDLETAVERVTSALQLVTSRLDRLDQAGSPGFAPEQ